MRSAMIVVAMTAVAAQRPPAADDACGGPVQSRLRYNISSRTTPEGVAAPVDANESLAEAVCCDARASLFAEPQFLYAAPDIALFSAFDRTGVATFYDSVCGLPLFRAPVNRSWDAFEADTKAHGWPSFRRGEIVEANVVVDADTGLVASTCGTHLGTYDADDAGPRYCVDLSCVAGAPPVSAPLTGFASDA